MGSPILASSSLTVSSYRRLQHDSKHCKPEGHVFGLRRGKGTSHQKLRGGHFQGLLATPESAAYLHFSSSRAFGLMGMVLDRLNRLGQRNPK
jgi:hypothetical protein